MSISGMLLTGMRYDVKKAATEAFIVPFREVHRQRVRTTKQAQPQQAEPRSQKLEL